MPDFSKLMNRPAGQAKKPAALPAGDYPCKIIKWELGESQQKKTPYVRYFLVPTGFPEGASEADKIDEKGEAIDLTKKQLRRDYYMTTDAEYRLDEMLRAVGVTVDGRTYEESVPDAVGMDCLAVVIQRMSADGSDNVFNDVTDVRALVA
jgi:hypothetical protein